MSVQKFGKSVLIGMMPPNMSTTSPQDLAEMLGPPCKPQTPFTPLIDEEWLDSFNALRSQCVSQFVEFTGSKKKYDQALLYLHAAAIEWLSEIGGGSLSLDDIEVFQTILPAIIPPSFVVSWNIVHKPSGEKKKFSVAFVREDLAEQNNANAPAPAPPSETDASQGVGVGTTPKPFSF